MVRRANSKKWSRAANQQLLAALGGKVGILGGGGLAGRGGVTNFLRTNPQLIPEYERMRREYEGQENFTAKAARQFQIDDLELKKIGGGVRGGGGAFDIYTGQAISRQQWQAQAGQAAMLGNQIAELEFERDNTKNERIKADRQARIDELFGQYETQRAQAQAEMDRFNAKAGGQIALTPEEVALREVGYTGILGNAANRWLEKQAPDNVARYNEVKQAQAKANADREKKLISSYGALSGFIPNELISKDASQSLAGRGIKTGIDTGTIDLLKAGKLGLDAVRLYKGLTGTKVATSGIAKAVNAWGASNLGLANVDKSFVGPLQPGVTSGTTLTGVLSGAATGALVGGVSSQVFGTHSTGSTVGGALGGAVGSVVPGIGTLAGSAIGTLIGGSFGSDPKPFSDFTGVFGTDALNYQVGAKHMSDKMGNEMGLLANNFLQEFERTTGIQIDNIGIAGGYSHSAGGNYVRTGYWRNADGTIRDTDTDYEKKFTFDPNNAQSIISAYTGVAVDYIAKTNKEVADLVSSGVSADAILAGLQARHSKATGAGVTPKDETGSPVDIDAPVQPSDPPQVKITKKAKIAQQQVDDFLADTEAGKTGIKGSILTSTRGILTQTPTIKRRIRAA